jgi:hypothetical protein
MTKHSRFAIVLGKPGLHFPFRLLGLRQDLKRALQSWHTPTVTVLLGFLILSIRGSVDSSSPSTAAIFVTRTRQRAQCFPMKHPILLLSDLTFATKRNFLISFHDGVFPPLISAWRSVAVTFKHSRHVKVLHRLLPPARAKEGSGMHLQR